MDNSYNNERTRECLIKHYQRYPHLQAEDIFKFIFQSSFGCEHLLSDDVSVLEYIKSEYMKSKTNDAAVIEKLDGDYSRVCLSCLNKGLSFETFARLFSLSAKKEPEGKVLLEKKTEIAIELVASGVVPLDRELFENKLNLWKNSGYPAIHHSAAYREAYCPAYRVISNRYADFLQVFCEIDRLMKEGTVIVAIEGKSASGKSTLSGILKEVYDCNVFHMDDFFLRPEQRTYERLSEVGGNLDRERFADEVLKSLKNNDTVFFSPFDCSTKTLGKTVTVYPKKLTIVEGVYSMHPAFSKYYDLSVFLEIDEKQQKKRIESRNSPTLAKRFFEEWIPLENTYFEQTETKKRCDIIFDII